LNEQGDIFMNSIFGCSKSPDSLLSRFALVAALLLAPALCVSGATAGKAFASPNDAVRALGTAVNNRDSNALAAIFGPEIRELKSPDPVQAENEVEEFAERLNASNHIERAASDRYILEIGADRFPFAIPIVQKGGSWFFDTDAGKEELLNRRIGRNELEALKSIRAYVDAQREYASKDRDDDQVLEYAQKMISSPDARDGLYWSPDIDGEISPLGPLYVEAQGKGYFKDVRAESGPQPFNGYYFKILTKQGKRAPGGSYNYVINGNMIGGFGLLAWPAEYGDSGVMSFMINQQGHVYQKDLGKDTEAAVKKIDTYEPDSSWTRSRD
jgi:hypothetical protein